MTTRIVIIGAGGHGLVVADILLAARAARATQTSGALDVVAFLDDNPALTGTRILDIPVLGTTQLLAQTPHDAVIVAIGDNARREQMATYLIRCGETLFTARHPHASVAADVEIGPGSTISAGAVITPGVRLGTGAILNTRCGVDHQTVIGDFAHVSCGATVGANVSIGARALVGLGASVLSNRHIGADTIIGAGAVVVHDIPDRVLAVGIPATVQRRLESAPELASDTPPESAPEAAPDTAPKFAPLTDAK
jgi:sugar O-acyltransferase (sialic acid O-acetyltransferase NeuD family)